MSYNKSISTFLLYYRKNRVTDMIKNEESSSKNPEESKSRSGNVRVNDNSRRNRFFTKKETFKGACEALEECIFDASDSKSTDRYTTTIKKIAVYVGTEVHGRRRYPFHY